MTAITLSTTSYGHASLCLPDPTRFWTKVRKTETCWVWTSVIAKNGYGYIAVDPHGKQVRLLAHRVSYIFSVGPIPEGYQIDHLCRVRTCVRPDHLEAVTQRTNLLRGDGWAGVNSRKTHCSQGHEYTLENTYLYKGKHRQCRTCHRAHENRRYAEGRKK